MKKVLLYKAKYDTAVFDISTSELENKAYKAIFKELDKDYEAYSDLYDDLEAFNNEVVCRHCNGTGKVKSMSDQDHKSYIKMSELYKKAKKGDIESLKELLKWRSRSHFEYEGLEEKVVEK